MEIAVYERTTRAGEADEHLEGLLDLAASLDLERRGTRVRAYVDIGHFPDFGLRQLRERIRARRVGVVLTRSLDRIARTPEQFAWLIAQEWSDGSRPDMPRLISVEEGIDTGVQGGVMAWWRLMTLLERVLQAGAGTDRKPSEAEDSVVLELDDGVGARPRSLYSSTCDGAPQAVRGQLRGGAEGAA
ncbi:hypothetical protein F1C76_13230 [Geodermatophilaceae bacterium NBWT11]|nr:hypothetical protein F1C76_13230 [Geodermatophilaceae bacterium NBWT11]